MLGFLAIPGNPLLCRPGRGLHDHQTLLMMIMHDHHDHHDLFMMMMSRDKLCYWKVWEYWQPGTYTTADKYGTVLLKQLTCPKWNGDICNRLGQIWLKSRFSNTICRQIICMALQTDGLKLYLSQVHQIGFQLLEWEYVSISFMVFRVFWSLPESLGVIHILRNHFLGFG